VFVQVDGVRIDFVVTFTWREEVPHQGGGDNVWCEFEEIAEVFVEVGTATFADAVGDELHRSGHIGEDSRFVGCLAGFFGECIDEVDLEFVKVLVNAREVPVRAV
jgi:hypothetical protein